MIRCFAPRPDGVRLIRSAHLPDTGQWRCYACPHLWGRAGTVRHPDTGQSHKHTERCEPARPDVTSAGLSHCRAAAQPYREAVVGVLERDIDVELVYAPQPKS